MSGKRRKQPQPALPSQDFWDAVTDIVIAQRETRIRAEQAQIAAEHARFEAERLAEKARIAAEGDQLGTARETEQARLAAERAWLEAERLAGQALAEAEKQTGQAHFETETYTSITAVSENRQESDAVKVKGKGRREKKRSAKFLPEAFKQFGFTFTLICRNRSMIDYEHDILGEVAIFLENASCAMAVASAASLKRKQVDDHIECMKKIGRYAGLHDDKRQFFGALAASRIDDDAKKYALEQGFYIIENDGGLNITAPPSGAKSW